MPNMQLDRLFDVRDFCGAGGGSCGGSSCTDS
jgi:hypothetical protein